MRSLNVISHKFVLLVEVFKLIQYLDSKMLWVVQYSQPTIYHKYVRNFYISNKMQYMKGELAKNELFSTDKIYMLNLQLI